MISLKFPNSFFLVLILIVFPIDVSPMNNWISPCTDDDVRKITMGRLTFEMNPLDIQVLRYLPTITKEDFCKLFEVSSKEIWESGIEVLPAISICETSNLFKVKVYCTSNFLYWEKLYVVTQIDGNTVDRGEFYTDGCGSLFKRQDFKGYLISTRDFSLKNINEFKDLVIKVT